jgi:hypothetical protein
VRAPPDQAWRGDCALFAVSPPGRLQEETLNSLN